MREGLDYLKQWILNFEEYRDGPMINTEGLKVVWNCVCVLKAVCRPNVNTFFFFYISNEFSFSFMVNIIEIT